MTGSVWQHYLTILHNSLHSALRPQSELKLELELEQLEQGMALYTLRACLDGLG